VQSEQHPQSPTGAQAASDAISAEMVRIHRESYGSGASSAKTYVHDDLVLSVIEIELLPAEVVVIAQGRSDLVLEMRNSFQLELETALTAAVEHATQRRVIAFLSDTHLDPPFVTELFRLGPVQEVELAELAAETEAVARPGVLRQRYASTADAAAAARRALGLFSDDLDHAELDQLRLLVSELVTNAVRHGDATGHGSIELDVELADGQIIGEVRDAGSGFEYQPATPGPTGGWGLLIVERVATRWGVTKGPSRVWFEITRDTP